MQEGRISGGNALVLARAIAAGRWAEVQVILFGAAEQAQAQDCDRVLFSSEWLLGSLAEDEALKSLKEVLGRCGDHALELFLLLREPVEQLISHYRHRAKSGGLYDLQTWADRDYLLPGRLSILRRQLESIDTQIVVRGYGKAPGALEQVFFADWLGVSLPPEASGLLVNPSLSLSELVLLRQLKATRPSLVPVLYARLLALDPALKTEAPAMRAYARQVAAQAVGRYAEEWAHWRSRLPESERFTIAPPEGIPGPEPSDLVLSSAQWAVLMGLLADATRPGFLLGLIWSSRLRPGLAKIKRALLLGRSKR